jgi:hypothetical protein
MNFTRVVPKFLSGYAEMLTGKVGGNRPPPGAAAVVGSVPGMASMPVKRGDEDDPQQQGGDGEDGEDEWDDVEKAALAEYEELQAYKKDGAKEKMLEKIRSKVFFYSHVMKSITALFDVLQAKKRKVIELTKQREEEDTKEAESGKHSFRVTTKAREKLKEKEDRKLLKGDDGRSDAGAEKKKKKKKKKDKAAANLLSFGDDDGF